MALTGASVSARTLKPPRSIVIDAHSHLGYMGSFGMQDISFEETLDAADEAGIDKLCVSAVDSLFFDLESGNESRLQDHEEIPDSGDWLRLDSFASLRQEGP